MKRKTKNRNWMFSVQSVKEKINHDNHVLTSLMFKSRQILAEPKPHVTHDCSMFVIKTSLVHQMSWGFRQFISLHFLLTSFQLLSHRPWPMNLDSDRQSFLSFTGSVIFRSISVKMSDYPSPLKEKRSQSRRWGGVPVVALLLQRRSRRSMVFRRSLIKSLPRNWTPLQPADGSGRLSWSFNSSWITAYSRFAFYIIQQLVLCDSLFWSFD